ENTLALVQQWQEEVKMLYTLLGKMTTEELTSTALILDPVLVNWCHNRDIDSTVFAKR
ncbi:type 2 isopentenyl-diphosphate Delta-isomerase, partial [Enterococcus faecalis]|nr:type 2 isopentenyl-diphosphate Delta-isomerase [Enterococcus faecalis]